ncbi:unnamed protein product [Discosporangium mesarthrocarpum]
MMFAPINPSDINQIEGTYGVLPPLPAVAGNEGVGQVLAVGPSVSGLSPKDWVIPMPAAGFGTWRALAKADQGVLQRCPNDIPAEQAATIGVNPCTALRMLRDFVKLSPGDCVIQNGANSQVGLAVVQIAREMKVKTINVVRRRPPEQEDGSAELVKSLGGDVVITQEELEDRDAYAAATAGLPRPHLGFNCTGGAIATGVAATLAPGGKLVTYGGMSMRPLVLSAETLQERGILCEGFWITRWAQENSRQVREEMIEEITEMIRVKKLETFVDKYPLSEYKEALQVSQTPFRSRKVTCGLKHVV